MEHSSLEGRIRDLGQNHEVATAQLKKLTVIGRIFTVVLVVVFVGVIRTLGVIGQPNHASGTSIGELDVLDDSSSRWLLERGQIPVVESS